MLIFSCVHVSCIRTATTENTMCAHHKTTKRCQHSGTYFTTYLHIHNSCRLVLSAIIKNSVRLRKGGCIQSYMVTLFFFCFWGASGYSVESWLSSKLNESRCLYKLFFWVALCVIIYYICVYHYKWICMLAYTIKLWSYEATYINAYMLPVSTQMYYI